MKYVYHLIPAFLPFFSLGQLTLGGSDPQVIANVLSGSGINISNIEYTGSSEAISYFSANTPNMPFHSGFLMTTGYRNLAVGPNNDNNSGVDNGYPGFNLINSYINSQSHNAAVLSFDLIPSGDSIKIKYIFGSEEYPEYVGGQFSDAFAIFIQGPGINGIINIATVPNYNIVSINTVNGGNPGGTLSGLASSQAINSDYFVNNGNGNQEPSLYDLTYLQYNGLTKPLIAKTKVIPNQTYHLIVVIVDGYDSVYDSGVFIEEGGITASTGENHLDNFVNVIYNPMDQLATIKITEHQGNLTCSVVDLSGKTMEQFTITETTTVDLSDYVSGMYLIRVEGDNGQVSKKIVR